MEKMISSHGWARHGVLKFKSGGQKMPLSGQEYCLAAYRVLSSECVSSGIVKLTPLMVSVSCY